MTTDNPSVQALRIGRLLLDGAEASWVARRLGVTEHDVSDSWRVCRELLATFWELEPADPTLDDVITRRPVEALRLLLDWQERLERQSLYTQANTDSTEDSEVPQGQDSAGSE